MPDPELAKAQPPKRTPQQARNVVAGVGFALLTLGTAAVDWRAGCILAGTLMITVAIVGTILPVAMARKRKR